MTTVNEGIFREYDIRGLADRDLNPEVMHQLARAMGAFFHSRGAKKIALGRDCRLSSDRLHDALTKGLIECGLDVVDIGLVPTPVLYYAVNRLAVDGGVMITGSHNPAEFNGFKICLGKTTIHGEDIQQIKHLYKEGHFPRGQGKPSQHPIIDQYIDEIAAGFQAPLNVKVVVDSGNGMGGIIGPKLYRKLGCDVVELYSTPDGDFPNHHPDPTVVDNLKDLADEVSDVEAPLGIGFDGDADRIGVVDKRGRVIFGDELLILYSRALLQERPGAKIISEVKASHRLFHDIERHGGVPILWKTGHSLIKAKMKEEGALLAGEMSGHIFFADRYFGFDDAIYAGARLLEIISQTGKTPAQLLADLPASFVTPEIRVDCADEKKFKVVDRAREAFLKRGLRVNPIDGARIEFSDGWGLVRASNTQPVLVYRFEATTKQRLDEIRRLVEDVVEHVMKTTA